MKLEAFPSHNVPLPVIHTVAYAVWACASVGFTHTFPLIACNVATPTKTRHQPASAPSPSEARHRHGRTASRPCRLAIAKSTLEIIVPKTIAKRASPTQRTGGKNNFGKHGRTPSGRLGPVCIQHLSGEIRRSLETKFCRRNSTALRRSTILLNNAQKRFPSQARKSLTQAEPVALSSKADRPKRQHASIQMYTRK